MAVVSGLLAALLAFSAVRKLSHAPDVVESYARAGVREEWLNPLAIVLLAGATGLVAGLFWEPLGLAAAGALVAYFLVACSFHLRNGDAAHLPTPLLMLALAAAVLALS
jgi:DoxX-like family